MNFVTLVTILVGWSLCAFADVAKPKFDVSLKARGRGIAAPAPVDLSVRPREVKIDGDIAEAQKVISELGRGPLDELPEAFEIEQIRLFNIEYEEFNLIRGEQRVEPWQWPGPWKTLVNLWLAIEKKAPTLALALHEVSSRYAIISPVGGARLFLDHYAVSSDTFSKWLSARENPNRYRSLGENDRDRLVQSIAKIRRYVTRFSDQKDAHSFVVPLEDGPQFIKHEMAILVADNYHAALVIKYNRGRRDD